MCILILTKRDGTLFDVTSILEEDIIKICIQLGHTHPMAVLCYLATKSIVLFQLADKMQCATCGANKVAVLCEETIAIRVSSPSTTHMSAIWLWWVGSHQEPSLHPPMGRRNSIHPLVTSTYLGECHNVSRHTFGIWQMVNYASIWRISVERSHCELNAPPEVLHQCLGETQ